VPAGLVGRPHGLAGLEGVSLRQEGWRIFLTGLPKACPDKLAGVTVIKLDFGSPSKHVGCATRMVLD
jgi:hypothetical protein